MSDLTSLLVTMHAHTHLCMADGRPSWRSSSAHGLSRKDGFTNWPMCPWASAPTPAATPPRPPPPRTPPPRPLLSSPCRGRCGVRYTVPIGPVCSVSVPFNARHRDSRKLAYLGLRRPTRSPPKGHRQRRVRIHSARRRRQAESDPVAGWAEELARWRSWPPRIAPAATPATAVPASRPAVAATAASTSSAASPAPVALGIAVARRRRVGRRWWWQVVGDRVRRLKGGRVAAGSASGVHGVVSLSSYILTGGAPKTYTYPCLPTVGM